MQLDTTPSERASTADAVDTGVEPRQERSKRTVEQILASAVGLFSSRGVAQVNLSRIARHAGLPTATVYRYFPNKASLLARIRHDNMVELRVEAQAIFDRATNREEFANALGKVIWQTYALIRERPFMHEIIGAMFSDRESSNVLRAANDQWVEMCFMAARRFLEDQDDKELMLRMKVLDALWDGAVQVALWSDKNSGDAVIRETLAITLRELGLADTNES